MNKPLVAAVSGVLFGATLVGSIVSLRWHGCRSHCNRTGSLERILAQPVSAPHPCSRLEAVEPPAEPAPPSACPTLVDAPMAAPEAQLQAAQIEYGRGNWECAAAVARGAVATEPQAAYRIIGAAACQQRDVPGIYAASKHLDAQGKTYLHFVCEQSGVYYHGHGHRWQRAK
jgi:hypothetical protein